MLMKNLEIIYPKQDYKMRLILREILSDNNILSSKRVVAFLAFVAMIVSYFVDQFTNHSIKPELFESLMWIVIAGLGITGVEKFAKK